MTPSCRALLLFLGTLAIGLGGCVNPRTRGQSAEETEKEKDLKSVGIVRDVAFFPANGLAPLSISGVGLVTGLSGTGGSPPGQFRNMLEEYLLKRNFRHVKELLDSSDNALVLVSALIPAGARKGDALDIDVVLPPGSKASSLRGGFLEQCDLYDYDTTKNISPLSKGPNRGMLGHILAHARGPLLVGFGKNEEPDQLRRGRVWGGGISHLDRPFFLVLNKDQQFARVANAVAGRINVMFPDDSKKRLEVLRNKNLLVLDEITHQINQKFAPPSLGQRSMARATGKEIIHVQMPYPYRLNPERYLRVLMLVPLQEEPAAMNRYQQRLHKMLLDPAETVRSALRLEALGKDSIPVLKTGLESPHPLVRFAAAEALAYLGSTSGCETLTNLAKQHSVLRAYCLLALSSLEEAICRQHLGDLLLEADAELRCGAFEALRQIDDKDKHLGGELLNQAFWLHRVAPGSDPMVFFSINQRAEIVLFGSDIHLVPPVKILAGKEFTVTAAPGDDRCTVTRFAVKEGAVQRKQCTLDLEDVLRTLTEMGGQYPDAVGLLNRAHELHCLSCPASFQTLPEMFSVEMLALGGRDPDFLKGP